MFAMCVFGIVVITADFIMIDGLVKKRIVQIHSTKIPRSCLVTALARRQGFPLLSFTPIHKIADF